MSITKLLLDRGLLNKEQLDEAIALNQAEGLRLDRAIIQLGFLSERQLLEIMSEQLNLPLFKPEGLTRPTTANDIINTQILFIFLG